MHAGFFLKSLVLTAVPSGSDGPQQELAENETQKPETGAPLPINVPTDEYLACMGNMFVCLIDCFLKTW